MYFITAVQVPLLFNSCTSPADSSTSFVRHLFSPVIIKAINLKFNSKRHLNTQDLTAQSMLNPQEEKVPPKKDQIQAKYYEKIRNLERVKI